MSVPANFQIASSEASTATRMQALVIQNAILRTMLGFRKPRRGLCSDKLVSDLRYDELLGVNNSRQQPDE
jgi:hypothetical protein